VKKKNEMQKIINNPFYDQDQIVKLQILKNAIEDALDNIEIENGEKENNKKDFKFISIAKSILNAISVIADLKTIIT
jgi:hypothetical protein